MAEISESPVIARCQTSCDDDCEAPCHESHEVLNRRHHDVAECEAGQRQWAEMVAELERLRESRRASLEINQGWVAYRERTKVRRREFLDKIAELTRERDALKTSLLAALAESRRWWEGERTMGEVREGLALEAVEAHLRAALPEASSHDDTPALGSNA